MRQCESTENQFQELQSAFIKLFDGIDWGAILNDLFKNFHIQICFLLQNFQGFTVILFIYNEDIVLGNGHYGDIVYKLIFNVGMNAAGFEFGLRDLHFVKVYGFQER